VGAFCFQPSGFSFSFALFSGQQFIAQIDQKEAALLGLTLTYPHPQGGATKRPAEAKREGSPLTAEVIRENQITGERIAF
jgi:hypothetical protein